MANKFHAIREELVSVVRKLDTALNDADAEETKEVASDLRKKAEEIARAWSGSWLGYHSRVYYGELQPAPPGEVFSVEWGLSSDFRGSGGDWRIYDGQMLVQHIRQLAGVEDFDEIWKTSQQIGEAFDEAKEETLSCLLTFASDREDAFMDRVRADVEKLKPITVSEVITYIRPSGQFFSRDREAVLQGIQTPPHILVTAQATAVSSTIERCEKLQKLAQRAASHIDKFAAMNATKNPKSKKVFIGHGKSLLWRELKDFLQDRLKLEWDEFNRVPVAGTTTISRLEMMLQEATFAFLVMTAEDESIEKKLRPRLNVVHEAGLFQGRLGFSKAIIVLEEGCEEFSNIVGLSQVRFPKGNIRACFEEIRSLLEREKLV